MYNNTCYLSKRDLSRLHVFCSTACCWVKQSSIDSIEVRRLCIFEVVVSLSETFANFIYILRHDQENKAKSNLKCEWNQSIKQTDYVIYFSWRHYTTKLQKFCSYFLDSCVSFNPQLFIPLYHCMQSTTTDFHTIR